MRAKVKGAIEEARAASTISHPGVKGTVLEILISRLFRPLLPSDIGIGTGQLIEQTHGTLSGQIDIILYDKRILPPALYDERTGIFPIESALYAIEVKTCLDVKGIQQAHENALQISKFNLLPGLHNNDGTPQHHRVERTRYAIFALSSNLNGKRQNEADRYKRIYQGLGEFPHIRAICVAGKEYWYDNSRQWISIQSENDFDDILSFIGGVINTYQSIAESRHFPRLGYYIIPPTQALRGPLSGGSSSISAICEGCGGELLVTPNLPAKDITINGRISVDTPCPKCGGHVTSKYQHFEFKNGLLQNEN
ncbi:DUF6602 domain-containing protein [Acidocella aromatica]|uniref:DUF6602 domain-containing protein n=1 Tax=Acidocella aromatica TaxID=1303579 RepID=A0A840V9U1_9PROT|nr:DUF6602 domain-containing protein [Acidocella aromatica]MBB5372523.1 hypothetical protein [Acidocella aromatica]